LSVWLVFFIAEVDLEGKVLHEGVEEDEGVGSVEVHGSVELVEGLSFIVFKQEASQDKGVGRESVKLEEKASTTAVFEELGLFSRTEVVNGVSQVGFGAVPEGFLGIFPCLDVGEGVDVFQFGGDLDGFAEGDLVYFGGVTVELSADFGEATRSFFEGRFVGIGCRGRRGFGFRGGDIGLLGVTE